MCRAGAQPQPMLLGERDHVVPQLLHVLFRVLDAVANPGAHLDDRLVHLRLDLLLQHHLSFFEDFRMDVGAQVAGDRIDGLVFLFDSDSEPGQHTSTFLELAMAAAGWPSRGEFRHYTGPATRPTAPAQQLAAALPSRSFFPTESPSGTPTSDTLSLDFLYSAPCRSRASPRRRQPTQNSPARRSGSPRRARDLENQSRREFHPAPRIPPCSGRNPARDRASAHPAPRVPGVWDCWAMDSSNIARHAAVAGRMPSRVPPPVPPRSSGSTPENQPRFAASCTSRRCRRNT